MCAVICSEIPRLFRNCRMDGLGSPKPNLSPIAMPSRSAKCILPSTASIIPEIKAIILLNELCGGTKIALNVITRARNTLSTCPTEVSYPRKPTLYIYGLMPNGQPGD